MRTLQDFAVLQQQKHQRHAKETKATATAMPTVTATTWTNDDGANPDDDTGSRGRRYPEAEEKESAAIRRRPSVGTSVKASGVPERSDGDAATSLHRERVGLEPAADPARPTSVAQDDAAAPLDSTSAAATTTAAAAAAAAATTTTAAATTITTNPSALRCSVGACLQEYWRVMGVRRTKEPLYWFREDDLGEVKGPATLRELQSTMLPPPSSFGASGQLLVGTIECRHAGMPAFVPLQFLVDTAGLSQVPARDVLLAARQALWSRLDANKS
jgi:hypothetical protein